MSDFHHRIDQALRLRHVEPLHRIVPSSRRGFKLWLVALMLGTKGLAYAVGDWEGTPTESALRLITEVWGPSVEACGIFMIVLCIFAGITAYSRHGRDRLGYIVLTAASVGYAACFAVSPILDGPLAPALSGVANYMLAAVLLLISAADPEPLSPDEVDQLVGLDARSEQAHEQAMASSQTHQAWLDENDDPDEEEGSP